MQLAQQVQQVILVLEEVQDKLELQVQQVCKGQEVILEQVAQMGTMVQLVLKDQRATLELPGAQVRLALQEQQVYKGQEAILELQVL